MVQKEIERPEDMVAIVYLKLMHIWITKVMSNYGRQKLMVKIGDEVLGKIVEKVNRSTRAKREGIYIDLATEAFTKLDKNTKYCILMCCMRKNIEYSTNLCTGELPEFKNKIKIRMNSKDARYITKGNLK